MSRCVGNAHYGVLWYRMTSNRRMQVVKIVRPFDSKLRPRDNIDTSFRPLCIQNIVNPTKYVPHDSNDTPGQA